MFFYCCLWARDHRVLLKGRNYRERKFYDRTIFKKVHGNLLTQNILIYINCKSLFSRKKERFLGSRKQKKYIYIHIYLIKLNNFCFFLLSHWLLLHFPIDVVLLWTCFWYCEYFAILSALFFPFLWLCWNCRFV